MSSRRRRRGGPAGGGARPSPAAQGPAHDEPAPARASDEVAEHLEELAEDMVSVLRRLQSLEESLAATGARVEHAESRAEELAVAHARALDTLRRELVGERRSAAALSVLDAMMPWMDALAGHRRRCAEQGMDEEAQQIDTTLGLLTAMLRGMGFVPLEAEAGEPFDHRRMEVMGYAEGQPGTVVEIVGPGYTSDGQVVRPARVLIPDPEAPPSVPEPENTTAGPNEAAPTAPSDEEVDP